MRKFTRQGEDFMHPRFGTEHGPLAHSGDRPGNLLRLLNCTNVLLSGVTLQNSPTWTVQVNGCEDVKINDLTKAKVPWVPAKGDFDAANNLLREGDRSAR